MFKLYNTQASIASTLSKFFKNIIPNISKPQLKIIPFIILGMIQSESVVTTDIVKTLKADFSLVSPFSSIRRLERFYNNSNFDIYLSYNYIIRHVISNFKSKNPNVYISFDHMYCRNSFTIFLISLKIGKQRYPSLVPLFQRRS